MRRRRRGCSGCAGCVMRWCASGGRWRVVSVGWWVRGCTRSEHRGGWWRVLCGGRGLGGRSSGVVELWWGSSGGRWESSGRRWESSA